MLECKVYRDSWLRGERGYGRLLRTRDNRMCCIGQIAFQAGIPLNELKDRGDLPDLVDERATVPYDLSPLDGLLDTRTSVDYDGEPYFYGENTTAASHAMQINDDSDITDAEREEKLAPKLKEAGVAVTFVDGVAPWFATQ